MQAIKTDWCNFVYLGPTPEIFDLHCRREIQDGRSAVLSYWKPSSEELEELQRGAVLVLGIHGMEPIPPVSLGVEFVPVTEADLVA